MRNDEIEAILVGRGELTNGCLQRLSVSSRKDERACVGVQE